MLEIRNISKHFGGIKALDNVTLSLNQNEIVGLIGPNGSGKTTLFNVICGLLKPDKGHIFFNGKEITNLSPEKISRLGISRTFQGTRLVEDLTVIENIIIATLPLTNSYDKAEELARTVINKLGIEKIGEVKVTALTHYERKIVELARTIACKPKVVLIDEIMAGLSEEEQQNIAEIMVWMKKEMNATIFWIEHIIRAMIKLVKVDRIIALESGKLIAEGKPEEVITNKNVIEAYLGITNV
jgi:ABC-type branched-chain amino acid transport systems, ATPase component